MRVLRFAVIALVAFAALIAFDGWLRQHGFIAAAVVRDWGEVVLYGDGKGSYREFTTTYPPIAFALNVLTGVSIREFTSLPPPLVAAALLAALLVAAWASALRAAGYGGWWSLVLTVLVCVHPFFLYPATLGVGAVLLLVAVYWYATAYWASRVHGRITDFMNLAFALAFTAFVHPLGALICVLTLPFLVLALPPDLIARSAPNSMLVLLFPLLFALGSFAYENALFEDGATPFLRNLLGHVWAAAPVDGDTRTPSVLPGIAALLVALAVVALRRWPAASRSRGAVAALLLAGVALGWSVSLPWRSGEPARWREAAMGTPVTVGQNAGVAALGRYLATRTDVLIDAPAHPEVLAARGSARGLVTPTDDAFMLTTFTHQIHSRFIAVPDPDRPGMLDDDLLAQTFPKLYAQGMRGYRLTYDANGWRVYERNDARNPV
ncbi:hypothetical protein ACTJKF_16120 [Burkholderia sp. 22313]